MRRLSPAPFAVLALALLVFWAWMHPAVLLPANVGWILDGNDRGQSAIGLAAYLRSGGPWPSLHQDLLAAPEGMTLLFTDSIPILGMLLKPFAAVLPGGLQFVGLWYLTCVLLQAAFAWALVRRHAPDAIAAWCGAALLTAMPALINRYGHASLCAQWLILWALWVFVDDRRARQPGWWAAVLCVAALVHSYLLLMVAAIWGSAVLMLLVREPRRVVTLLGAAAALGATAAVVGLDGVYGQHFASTHAYGSWPVALDAWWNPANPSYTALLPSSPDQEAQGFEGLQYLGAGLLALVALAIVTLLRGGGAAGRPTLRRLAWLLPAFLVLAVVAIGPAPIWRGEALFRLHLGRQAVDLLDPVRAAGRLVWPATYVLAFAAIVLACRWRRATLILAAALALQVVDLTPMVAAVRTASAGADDARAFHRTRDARWDMLIGNASAVEFEPAERFVDLALMEEVAWRAIAHCRPTRYFYASRDAEATLRRVAADSAAFRRGELDPTRLYILLDRRAPPMLAGRVRLIDGVAVVAPSRPAPPPRC